MHIGLIIYGSLDTVSGGYLYDRQLVMQLREQGHTVEVISLPWRNYARHLQDNFSQSLLEQLNNASFDLLLQDELNHPSLFKLNGRLQANYPIIAIVHHLRINEAHPSWQMPLYEAVEQSYLQSVDGFIFNSETTRRSVEAWLEEERPYIVAPPAGNQFNHELTEDQLRKKLADEGVLRILFVGNIIPRKGLHTLLDAVRQLPINSYQLDIVGDTAVDPKYAHRCLIAMPINGKIDVHGKVSNQRLEELYQQSHLLVVPSQHEGFGIVYLEGMQFGLPAIGTTTGAAHEIIRNGRNGYLVPPDNPDQLAAKLLMLQRNRALLETMSLDAWKSYQKHPSWKESMTQAVHFLENFR